MKYYIIYKTTNLINNKIYIGLHTTENINDNYLGSGIFLKKAIKKYGYRNFEKEILFVFDNKLDMIEKEKELVNEEFVCRKDTYNMTKGGYGLSTLSDEKRLETIEKIRKTNLERDHTESAKQRLKTLLKNDKDIFKKMGVKSSIKQKENYKNGYINPNQSNHIIKIYNSDDELMFRCLQVDFKKICTENSLPSRVLQQSYERKGTPIYVIQRPTNMDFSKYKHWYALRNDDERIDALTYIKSTIDNQKDKNRNNNLIKNKNSIYVYKIFNSNGILTHTFTSNLLSNLERLNLPIYKFKYACIRCQKVSSGDYKDWYITKENENL